MPRHHHSSRSPRNFKTSPDQDLEEAVPARKFPILYVCFIVGGLFAASVSVTAMFLLGAPVKPTTTKSANSLRTVPPAANPSPLPADNAGSASPATPAPLATESQPFLLRPTNLDSTDATASDAGATQTPLAGDELERKESLAEMEFRSKNYPESERIYRELLPIPSRQPLTIYQIYTCLLLQDHRDDAEKFLAQAALTEESPASYYCKATLAFTAGDATTARQNLDEARRLFPDRCAPYDLTLKDLGYLP